MEFIGSNDLWAKGAEVKITATIKTIRPQYKYMNLYYMITDVDDCNPSDETAPFSKYSEMEDKHEHSDGCDATMECYYISENGNKIYVNASSNIPPETECTYSWSSHHSDHTWDYVVYYECEQDERKTDECGYSRSPDQSIEYISTYTDSNTSTRTISETTTTGNNGYYSIDIALDNYTIKLDNVDGVYATYNKGTHGPYYEYITEVTVTFTYNGAEYEVTYDYANNKAKYTSYSSSGNAGIIRTSSLGLKNNVQETSRDRSNLNTIALNKDTANKDIPYIYNGINAKTSSLNIANGNSTTVYKNVGYRDSYFAKNATTGSITTGFGIGSSIQDVKNICMALSPRTVDLALYMNVDNTQVKINGKSTIYRENEININTDNEIKNWLNSNSNVDVNIYKTDYYYRILDYTDDNGKALANDPTLDYSKTFLDEIDIKVTYKVTMLKQAITYGSSQINQLIYYYDSDKYELSDISDNYTNWTPANSNYHSINGYNAIIINGSWNLDNDNPTLYFTFTVRKDGNNLKTGKVKDNIVAITSYSTQYGFLDSDSSTRNIVNMNNANESNVEWEDDTSKAQGVTIKITDERRTISGNIFNDLNKDANFNNNDETVNDVVVQLIEITKNNNEYIWQETVAGSGIVKSLVNIGEDYKLYNYNAGDVGVGGYKFVNIVPGNYIVRFIYGDGYNYDITVNNTKYNGADYKSTKDANYRVEWYNTTNYFGTGSSVARDNEARRLEVMATTSEIDAGLGTSLAVYANNLALSSLNDIEKINIVSYMQKLASTQDNEFYAAISKVFNTTNMTEIKNIANDVEVNNLNDKYLNVLKKCIAYKTFMVAETSKINMPIDTSDLKTTDSFSMIQHNKIDINFADVNFGITLRPEVKLELEKHITSLKITPNGTGVQPIIDARANIQNIMNNTETIDAEPTGETKGLLTIKSARGERGKWDVQTKTEELAQGANLEVEYTYVVKNTGEEDYISQTLANEYSRNPSEYSKFLMDKVAELKANPELKGKTDKYGDVLGTYYYTGDKGTNVAVASRVELFGEAINNELRYDVNTAGSSFKKVNEDSTVKAIYETNGEIGEEKIETIVETTSPTNFLTTGTADVNKTIYLTKVLASLNTDNGANIPSYIAEVLKYSSASGARNLEATPGNLSYVHSKDTERTMETDNENDEFWGETIMIGKPTGENKVLPVKIGITVVASVAIIGVGLVLIKKYVLTK